ncbi:MAG TPA: CopG family transcriptional regulator [Phenylobacterium sp.]|nr:CopG family transcriptional regulator [Phenylobacterium sp.]
MLESGMADPSPKSPPNDTAAFEKAVEEGVASLDQGRSLSYEKVRRWLLSWGIDREAPPPECP